MKLLRFSIIAFCCCSAIIFSSCSKSKNDITTSTTTPVGGIHKYGLNPMQPSDWANAPVFSANNIPQGITYPTTLPGAYLLNTPMVRDQGQIGSCTGFCGTEANEMVKYYAHHSNSITGTIDYSNALAMVNKSANQIANTSQTSNSGALSPLFLYYVERCVIEHQSITSDPGANMVNIGQALQGFSNNTGTGAPLTTTTKNKGQIITNTYAGECIETDYSYPCTTGSSGYNVATKSTGNYQTAPNPAAISNATIYELATQSGSANSGGTTTSGGYYVINSTGSTLINDVETAIASNLPVMMGFTVFDNKKTFAYFENLSTTSYVYDPIDPTSGNIISGLGVLGGHAVPLVGYITNASDNSIPASYGGGVFVVENSWGTPWGYHGYFYLPFNVLTNAKVVAAGDLWVLVN